MQDTEYKAFMSKLLPTVPSERIIGVRVPAIRAMAKELATHKYTEFFLNSLPHAYYEEDVLHVFLVANIKDYRLCISKINTFLPYVDNWGVCDSLRPKCFAKHKTELLGKINQWLSSPHPYTIRFAIEMLMVHFLDEDFSDEYLDYVATVKSNDYYVKMMIAWYFATALSKQYDAALPYLENNVLPTWTHNKTIQKSVESYRLDEEQKSYLRTLKQHY